MFALLFVAGLCYCVCPSAAFCDNDENESVYCEDSPMVPICVHFLMFSFSIIGLAVACLYYAIIGYEASLETDDEFGSSFDVRLVTLACLVGFGAWSCVSCVGFWYGLLGLAMLFGSND